MDAQHFRRRAAEVRMLAETARDAETFRLLLEVARDLEVEAAELDGETGDRRVHPRIAVAGVRALVRFGAEPPVEASVIDLSHGGAAVDAELQWPAGSPVTLELAGGRCRLDARVVRAAGGITGLAFQSDAATIAIAASALRGLDA